MAGPKMTKQHFEFLADSLAIALHKAKFIEPPTAVEAIRAFTAELATTNPAFRPADFEARATKQLAMLHVDPAHIRSM